VLSEASERVRFSLHRGGQLDVWRSPARFKVVAAGRRWGKTHLARTWLFNQAIKQGRGRYWYVAPTREDAKDIMWADLKDACRVEWLAESPRESDLALALVNGAEVRLWSAEKGDTLRGRSLKALVMDEYADMDASVFHEVLRPSLADYRAPALFIGTPKSYNHFYELYERGQSAQHTTWASWQFQSRHNPLMYPEEILEAQRTTDPRTFRQEWEASFEALAGRAYYAFERGRDVGPVTLEPGLPVCISFDFNVHPAVATIGQAHGDEPWFWRQCWVEHAGGEATIAACEQAKGHLSAAGWTGPIRIYGDATGKAAKTTGPSDHAVVRAAFPGAEWRIPHGNPHVKDRIAAVNARCTTSDGQRHIRVDPSCTRLIADFEQVVFDKNGELDQKTNPLLTHMSSAAGYWIVRDFPIVPLKQVVGVARLPEWM
jgi:hypothetical protein